MLRYAKRKHLHAPTFRSCGASFNFRCLACRRCCSVQVLSRLAVSSSMLESCEPCVESNDTCWLKTPLGALRKRLAMSRVRPTARLSRCCSSRRRRMVSSRRAETVFNARSSSIFFRGFTAAHETVEVNIQPTLAALCSERNTMWHKQFS